MDLNAKLNQDFPRKGGTIHAKCMSEYMVLVLSRPIIMVSTYTKFETNIFNIRRKVDLNGPKCKNQPRFSK